MSFLLFIVSKQIICDRGKRYIFIRCAACWITHDFCKPNLWSLVRDWPKSNSRKRSQRIVGSQPRNKRMLHSTSYCCRHLRIFDRNWRLINQFFCAVDTKRIVIFYSSKNTRTHNMCTNHDWTVCSFKALVSRSITILFWCIEYLLIACYANKFDKLKY